jgi:hypothetical protein
MKTVDAKTRGIEFVFINRGFFLASRAQSNLSQLSDETGAESYSLGTGAPVTLKPYFDEISTHLSNQ